MPPLRSFWSCVVVVAGLVDCASSPTAPQTEPSWGTGCPAPGQTLPAAGNQKGVASSSPGDGEREIGDESAQSGSGTAREAPPPTADEVSPVRLPRMTSVGLFTYIYARPTRRSYQLGYLHMGSSIGLRSPEPLRRAGCDTAWYAVEPRGFVCNDNTTILESEQRKLPPSAERLLKGFHSMTPSDGPLPYGYALSLGTPMYGRIPALAEQQRSESIYGAPPVSLGAWAKGHEGLASADPVAADGEVPWFLADGRFSPVTVRGSEIRLVRKVAPRGSMIAYSSTFEAEGRTWLLTPELSVVPADRVRPYRRSTFHGVTLDPALQLPIGWIRKRPRTKWRAVDGGRMIATDDAWAVRSVVRLTGRRVQMDDRVFLETGEVGMFIEESDATVVAQSLQRPLKVAVDEKWIQISIQQGTLTAYEGDRPVFATLVSPGIGGLQRTKYPSVHALASRHITPLGSYRIQFKDRFSVMSPDPEQKKFFIADVPYIQYFYGPFALHATFWHEDFGEPKSGGCINLSPEDAARVFAWTDPPLPTGWQAVRSIGKIGHGTMVEIVP